MNKKGQLIFRLKRGELLKETIRRLVENAQIPGAFVMTCVGSLSRVKLRMPKNKDRPDEQLEIKVFDEFLEIVALSGTIAHDGKCHLHIACARKDGSVIGGHLVGEDCVHTTVEIILGVTEYTLDRTFDNETGFDELCISETTNS